MVKAFFERIFRQRWAQFQFCQGDRDTSTPVTNRDRLAARDARYTRILASIPPTSWPTTKKILGFVLCAQTGLFRSTSIMAASLIFDLEQSTIYKSLDKLRSVLKIPRPKRAHLSGISFRDASFIDYLTDSTRSKSFCIDVAESCDDLVRRLSRFYIETWDDRVISEPLERVNEEILLMLRLDVRAALRYGVTGELKTQRGRGPFVCQEDRSECLDLLSQVNNADLFDGDVSWVPKFVSWLFRLWEGFPEELRGRGLVNVIRLRDLRIAHLGSRGGGATLAAIAPTHLNSSTATKQFMEWLESGQHYSPEAEALIFGSTPGERRAILCHISGEQQNYWYMSYPY